MKVKEIAVGSLLAAGALFIFASPALANGNGGGHASGKPANGTVGNANDKTPGGQSSGDKNRGFKCDDNHGVGQGNPSHTTCGTNATTTTTEQSTTTTTEENVGGRPVSPPPHHPTTVATGSNVSNGVTNGVTTPVVVGKQLVRTPAPVNVATPAITSLPFTGAPVGHLAAAGLASIGLGIGLGLAARKLNEEDE